MTITIVFPSGVKLLASQAPWRIEVCDLSNTALWIEMDHWKQLWEGVAPTSSVDGEDRLDFLSSEEAARWIANWKATCRGVSGQLVTACLEGAIRTQDQVDAYWKAYKVEQEVTPESTERAN